APGRGRARARARPQVHAARGAVLGHRPDRGDRDPEGDRAPEAARDRDRGDRSQRARDPVDLRPGVHHQGRDDPARGQAQRDRGRRDRARDLSRPELSARLASEDPMAIEIKQQLRLSQQLVMTPQLQQAIKLLQLSRLELADVVTQELQENPVLEVSEEADEGELPREVEADSHEAEAPVASTEAVADEVAEHREASDAEKIADIDWQSYAEAYPQTGFQGEMREDDERRSLEGTLTRRETLAEHLDWQLQLSDFSEPERAAAKCIIGNLDDDGYLRADFDELMRAAGVPLAVVQSALRKVQMFDPTGVAARDLRECLLLQIDLLGVEDALARTL